MELQKIGAVGLNPREYRSRDGFDTDLAASQERMQETIDRLSQPIKSFKLEKAKISAVWFEIEEMTLFVGLCSGRVGIFVRDPSKHGGVEDVSKVELNIVRKGRIQHLDNILRAKTQGRDFEHSMQENQQQKLHPDR